MFVIPAALIYNSRALQIQISRPKWLMIDMNPTPALSLSRSLLDDSRKMEDVRSVTDWISFFFYIRVSRPRISARSLIINNRRGLALHKMKRKKNGTFSCEDCKNVRFLLSWRDGQRFLLSESVGTCWSPPVELKPWISSAPWDVERDIPPVTGPKIIDGMIRSPWSDWNASSQVSQPCRTRIDTTEFLMWS